MLEVDVTVLAFILGTVIPLIVGVLTKVNASSSLKAVVNLVLSIVAGGVAYLLQNDGSGTWMELAAAMVLVFLASGTTYTNMWKPSGIAGTVQVKTEGIGLGKGATYFPSDNLQ